MYLAQYFMQVVVADQVTHHKEIEQAAMAAVELAKAVHQQHQLQVQQTQAVAVAVVQAQLPL
jgi:hypothetical protein